jgi:uncharacterized protein
MTLAIAEEGTVFEPNHPKLVRVDVPLARLPSAFDGFTIVQLSDFHYDDLSSIVPIHTAIEVSNRLNPDLIVLTGDFVTVSMWADYLHNKAQAANNVDSCAQILAQMRARMGVISILGNHDVASDPRRITESLQFHGIPVLRNGSSPLEKDGQRLWLAGLDDALEGKPDVAATLRGLPANEPVLMLAHEPDFADEVTKHPVDLQLSGHSHGGQMRLPFLGAPYLPEMGRKYPGGLYRIGSLKLYTNIGIGTIRVPVRINCPPEITLLTLRSQGRS